MAGLVSAAQFPGLTPDIFGAFQRGQATTQRGFAAQQGAVTEDLRQQLVRQKLAQAKLDQFKEDPDTTIKSLQAIGIDTQQKLEEASRFAHAARNAPTPEAQTAIIQRRVDEIRARNGDPKQTLELLSQTPEQREPELQVLEAAALTAEQRAAQSQQTAQLGLQQQKLDAPPPPTSLQRNVEATGLIRGTPEFQEAIQKGITRAPLVQVGSAVSPEQKQLGKDRAISLAALREKGNEAENQIHSLDILDAIDVKTGIFAPMKQALSAFARGLGVNADNLANVAAGQSFTAEAGKLILKVLSTQKGVQTEADRAAIAQTINKLGNVPEANVFINNSARASARRLIEKRDFFNNFLAENKTLKGADKDWNARMRNTPLISKNRKDADGLPVFFFKFRDRVLALTPPETDPDKPSVEEQILEEWQRRERGR